MPTKKEIIYPVFLECTQFTEDSFWELIFEDLAHGTSPNGTYINKGSICCSYKGKEFSYKIERKDPEELYTDIYSLLTKKLGILSQKEKMKKRLSFRQMESNIMESHHEWSNIRKKNVKEVLFEKYVIKMKNQHDLTIKQTKFLLSIILLSIMFKTITNDDIVYEGDSIQNIKGITFEHKKIVLIRSIYANTILDNTPVTPVRQPKQMSKNWDKYLKTLRKNK